MEPPALERCPACGRDAAPGTRFCTGCGSSLRPRSRPAGAKTARGLVACPFCGAVNAASRRRCARCGRDSEGQQDTTGEHETAPADAAAEAAEPADRSGAPAVLIIVAVFAALAMLGVVATILSAQGVGPFGGPPEPPAPPQPQALEVAAVRASSILPPSGDVSYDADNVLDGDLETAWLDASSGPGEGEWIELVLPRRTLVSRVVLANGYQKDEQFDWNARVAVVRITADDRAFTADVVDVRGLQAIDLPATVLTRRVRLEILELHPGERYADTGFSVVELHGPSPAP